MILENLLKKVGSLQHFEERDFPGIVGETQIMQCSNEGRTLNQHGMEPYCANLMYQAFDLSDQSVPNISLMTKSANPRHGEWWHQISPEKPGKNGRFDRVNDRIPVHKVFPPRRPEIKDKCYLVPTKALQIIDP